MICAGCSHEVGTRARFCEACGAPLDPSAASAGATTESNSASRARVYAALPRIVFRCSPYHQNIPLYPLMTHIETLPQVGRGEPPEVKLHKLEEMLGQSGLPRDETVPLFAAMLSLPLPEGRYPALALGYTLFHCGVWLQAILRETDALRRHGAELLELARESTASGSGRRSSIRSSWRRRRRNGR